MQWNHEVDRALVSQVPEDEIRQIKQKWITERIRLSIDVFGKCPEKLAGIITTATAKLALLISKILTATRELKNKLFHEALKKEYGSKAVVKAENTVDVVSAPVKETIIKPEPPSVTITGTVPETKVIEQPKPQIPSRPVMPPEAAAFPRLQKVKVTLDKHNNLIFEAERERTKLEIELSDLKGLARLTKKKELESRIIRYRQTAWICNGAGFLHSILYRTACNRSISERMCQVGGILRRESHSKNRNHARKVTTISRNG